MGSDHIPHHHHPVKIHSSSILLLQERFKELERVKEMRQGRDLLMRRLWESERYTNTTSDTTTSPSVSDHHHDYDHGDDDDQTSKSLWFTSEILLIPQPTRARHPNCHLQQQQKISLSLRPISQMNMKKKKKKTCLMLSPPLISDPNESDVDTSLHL